MIVNEKRTYDWSGRPDVKGPVVYWMSRDQRVRDNWALLHAQQLAQEKDVPVVVVFCLTPDYLGATARAYRFMLAGLQEVERELAKLAVPFFLLRGDPPEQLAKFAQRNKAGIVVCDFNPLRISMAWKKRASELLTCRLVEVDAHNVVPCRFVSNKREIGARTLRPKIKKLLGEFLVEIPDAGKNKCRWPGDVPQISWESLCSSKSTSEFRIDWIEPGQRAGNAAMLGFIENQLGRYDEDRNSPDLHGESNLSPYIHFGHISAQRVALEALNRKPEFSDAFLEQLIVRRELSDNFCLHEPHYDNPACFPEWARRTLDDHRKDARVQVYTLEQFEAAQTHDPLWNAAQNELVRRGKMHNMLRMYWSKMILAWSASPEEAMETCVSLNDKYELDGRDPNGYAGIAWSIGGVHDRPWPERPVFGKIRCMTAASMRRKHDCEQYINKYASLQ